MNGPTERVPVVGRGLFSRMREGGPAPDTQGTVGRQVCVSTCRRVSLSAAAMGEWGMAFAMPTWTTFRCRRRALTFWESLGPD